MAKAARKSEFHPTAEQWALDFLDYTGYPKTKANVRNLIAWSAKEGTKATFNPLATIDKLPGSTDFNYNNGYPVQNYASYKDGIVANARHLKEHGGPIKTVLKRGNASVSEFADAVRRDGWGSGSFGEAPAKYVSPALAGGVQSLSTGSFTDTGTSSYSGINQAGAIPSKPNPQVYGVAPYDPNQAVRAPIPLGNSLEAPGSAQVGSPQPRSPQETWQLISSQPFVSPETQNLLPV